MATPKRVVVIGASGSGKSWLARRLAAKWNLTFIELDDLAWDKGWVLTDTAKAAERVEAALRKAKNGWVIAGNYSSLQPAYWKDVQRVIWLDLPFINCTISLLGRALVDVIRRRPICNGNRQTFWQLVGGKDALLWWNVRTFISRRRKNAGMMAKEPGGWTRITSRAEAKALVE